MDAFPTVNSIIKIYASLGGGSAFMHSSKTANGGGVDVNIDNLMAYAVFTELLKALQSNSSILNELSNRPR